MVLVVAVNISLILFSLTYLFFRPFYFKHFPSIVKNYDKFIMGIEPHRVTDSYIKLVNDYKTIIKLKSLEERKVESDKVLKNILIKLESISKPNTDANSKLNVNIALFKEAISQPYSLERNNKTDAILHSLDEDIYNMVKTSTTEEYEELSKYYRKIIHLEDEKGTQEEVSKILAEMDTQMMKIVKENPFQESGQTSVYKQMQKQIKDRYQKVWTIKQDKEYNLLVQTASKGDYVPSTVVAFTWYWRNTEMNIQEKFDIFDKEFRPLLAINYYRNIGLNGKPVDNFFVLDAPFFIFFLLEFLIHWYISVRRKEYIAWFLYPMYHWYDVVGLIPLPEFRVFRLIRIYQMYVILKESEYTKVGEDIVSKTIKYYSSIVKEEISDMVTIQILSETQAEIKAGTSADVLVKTIDNKRQDIKKVVIAKIYSTINNPKMESKLQGLLSQIVDATVSYIKLKSIIPEEMLVKFVVNVFHVFSAGVADSLKDENVRKSLEGFIDVVLDEVIEGAKDKEINELNQIITYDLLENIKKSVAIKKWAQDQ